MLLQKRKIGDTHFQQGNIEKKPKVLNEQKPNTVVKLEESLFGFSHKKAVLNHLEKKKKNKKAPKKKENEEKEESSNQTIEEPPSFDQLFFVDKGGEDKSAKKKSKKKETKEKTEDKKEEGKEEEENQEIEEEEEEEEKKEETKPKVAWVDEDDEAHIKLLSKKRLKKLRKNESENQILTNDFEQRLRDQFTKMHPHQEWASLEKKSKRSDDESEDETIGILQKSSRVTIPRGRAQIKRIDTINVEENEEGFEADAIEEKIKVGEREVVVKRGMEGGYLNISRVRDANQKEYSQSVVQDISFHHSGKIILTAGFDKTLRIFQVDGKFNEKIQAIHFDRMQIHSASFTMDGTQVIISGRRKFFYVFDINSSKVETIPWIQGRPEKSLENFVLSPCGKYITFLGNNGNIILVSAQTKRLITTLKMNGTVTSIAYTKDGRYLFSFGGDGEVYKWDMNKFACVLRFRDDGCIHGTSIAVGHQRVLNQSDIGESVLLACGSDTGIVNLYRFDSDKPVLIHTFKNLVTPITKLKFSHDSQILAMCSRLKKNAFRFAHVPSQTVFSNFPDKKTNLGNVSTFDWSPSSGYFAIGNDKGKALLFRIHYYPTV